MSRTVIFSPISLILRYTTMVRESRSTPEQGTLGAGQTGWSTPLPPQPPSYSRSQPQHDPVDRQGRVLCIGEVGIATIAVDSLPRKPLEPQPLGELLRIVILAAWVGDFDGCVGRQRNVLNSEYEQRMGRLPDRSYPCAQSDLRWALD